MIQVGEKFERNTVDGTQFIMEAIEVNKSGVEFNMSHKHPENGTPFSHYMSNESIRILIKKNNMAKI